MFARIQRRLLCICIIVISSAGAYWSVRFAQAERMSMRDSLADREAATNLAPGDAKNWVRLAHFEQQRGLNAGPAYLRAVAASPLSAEAWIGLGLEEELAGDFPAAERHLLHAAEISREYVPRWTLLNYYFRQDDAAHFWPWAKQALI